MDYIAHEALAAEGVPAAVLMSDSGLRHTQRFHAYQAVFASRPRAEAPDESFESFWRTGWKSDSLPLSLSGSLDVSVHEHDPGQLCRRIWYCLSSTKTWLSISGVKVLMFRKWFWIGQRHFPSTRLCIGCMGYTPCEQWHCYETVLCDRGNDGKMTIKVSFDKAEPRI
jgi:hypothetical protein